jgi:fibronectin type 3 domain-containing protein
MAAASAASAITPATPTGLTAQVVQTSVYLRWQKNTETGITGYQMSKKRSDGTWASSGVASGAIYLVNNLPSGVPCAYRIAAINSEGKQSGPSEAVSFTPRDTIPPPGPSAVAAIGEDSQIRLTWANSTAPDLDLYLVYRQNANGTWPTSASATTTSPASIDLGLSDGTTYHYRVTAVDHAGNESAPSSTVAAMPRDTTPPSPPEGASEISGEDSRVTLSWSASLDPRIDHYVIYRQGVDETWPSTPTATVPATWGLSPGWVTYSDTGLSDGTAYAYRISAVDRAGSEYLESAPTGILTGTPRDTSRPAAPEGASAMSAEDSHVTLTWIPSSDPRFDHYAIYRESPEGVWPTTPIAETSAASLIDGGLSDGILYFYRVATVDHAGSEYIESWPTTAITATPRDVTPPPTPEDVAAESGEESQVRLSWNAVSDLRLDHYVVYRQNPDGTWPTSPVAATTRTAYIDTEAVDGVSYTYRVITVDHAGSEYPESSPSVSVSASPKNATVPGAPDTLTSEAEDSQVTVAWRSGTDLRLDHYAIYRENPDGSWPSSPLATVAPGTSSAPGQAAYTDNGLIDGLTYSYRVTDVDLVGAEYAESAPSPVTTATPRDTTQPTTAEGLVAQGEDGRVSLVWTPTTDARFDHYVIYRQNGDGTWPSSPTAESKTSKFTDGGLLDGATFSYRVAVVDHAGIEAVESPPSTVAFATPKASAPPAPEGLVAQSGEDGEVDITWTANTEPSLDHYELYRQNNDGSWPSTPTGASSTPAFTDTGLSDGSAYSYRVTAVDHAGVEYVPSLPSTVATATPKATPPAAPEGLTAQSGEESKTYLSWMASANPRLDHYAVYRQDAHGEWPTAPIAETSSSVFTDTGLTDGTTYAYRITAVDAAGSEHPESVPSTTATATPKDLTPPAAPAELTATGGNELVVLAWMANPEPDIDHYTIYRQNPDGSWPTKPLTTTRSTSYSDNRVLGGAEYTYRLTAFDHNGNESTASATASALPTETAAPAAPAEPVITSGEKQLGISWPLNAEYNISRYALYRREADGSWPSTPLAETTHNWWTDRGLTNGSGYEYRVTAINHAGLVSAASPATRGSPGHIAIPDPGQFFAASSTWNEPLESGAEVDPRSQLMLIGIEPSTGQPAPGAQGGLMASINKTGTSLAAYSGYSSPTYIVPANQPLVPVHVLEPTVVNHVTLEQELSQGVPIPPNAQSAAGTDGHMSIYQPSTETLWDLWRACSPEGPNNQESWVAAQTCPSTPASTWTVQYGGVMRNVSQSLGYFDANSDPGFSGYFWGSTATSLPVAAGMVTMAELQAGEIKHALALDIPGYGLPGAACAYYNWRLPNNMGTTPIAYPAQRSDGTYFGPDCIPQGARLRIDPTFNLNSIQLPKVARMFAVAAQKYGMIVRDRDAGGVSFFAEDPVSLRQEGVPLNPYTSQAWTNAGSSPSPSGLLAGNPTWSLFKNFPWSHVQVMKLTICHSKLTPCPAAGN